MVKTKERSLCELDYFKLFNDTCQMIINVIQTIIILVTVLRTVNYSGNKFPGF